MLTGDMRVWIDQDLCTGDGLCVDHCHDVFTLLEDGIAYVVEQGVPQNDPGSSGSLAPVPVRHVESVIKAAEVCPGECIFIEIDPPVDAELDVEVDGRIAARVEIRHEAGDTDDAAA
jgi:ferredoxin